MFVKQLVQKTKPLSRLRYFQRPFCDPNFAVTKDSFSYSVASTDEMTI